MRIGILGHTERPDVGPAIDRLVEQAEALHVDLLVADELQNSPGDGDRTYRPLEALAAESEMLVALGGDGTMLRAANLMRDRATPILGINLGRLGFLTGGGPDALDGVLDKLQSGTYRVEDRMALEATVGGATRFALNEVVIEKGVSAQMVQVKTWIGGTSSSSFFGNGLIAASPTGSTGYNLSAGGPVLHPSMDALILTPICPHSLTLRPIVVPGDQSVSVELIAQHTDIMVTVDGQTGSPVGDGQLVEIRRAAKPVRLVNLHDLSFYELLRTKLDWSQDRREQQE